MGTTRGRTYAEFLKGARRDPVTGIHWLVFGEGEMPTEPSLALTALATSGYRCPALIGKISRDRPARMLCRERHGLTVDEAPAFGYDPDREEDQMLFWSCQNARHPAARGAALRVARRADDPWLVRFIEGADASQEACRRLVEDSGARFDGDALNTALGGVNLVTFRTPAYLLSCAQDFRPGRPGYQQHVWQATLDADAVVFTNHPGTDDESAEHERRPNLWAGNRWLPRAAQHENVLVCVHHVPADDPLPFTHAYFPRAAFDEVTERGNWTFGRKGEGYVALYSQHAPRRHGADELRADAPDNVWLCEMGDAATWDTFAAFVEAVTGAPVEHPGPLSVVYRSPTVGEVRFGWSGPLTVAGAEVPLSGYPRLDCPYGRVEFGEAVYAVEYEGDRLTWDLR